MCKSFLLSAINLLQLLSKTWGIGLRQSVNFFFCLSPSSFPLFTFLVRRGDLSTEAAEDDLSLRERLRSLFRGSPEGGLCAGDLRGAKSGVIFPDHQRWCAKKKKREAQSEYARIAIHFFFHVWRRFVTLSRCLSTKFQHRSSGVVGWVLLSSPDVTCDVS